MEARSLLALNKKRPAASLSEHLLRGVGHVEEAVLVLVVLVHLSHGEGHAGHAAVVDEQVEGLRREQRHPVPVGRRGRH